MGDFFFPFLLGVCAILGNLVIPAGSFGLCLEPPCLSWHFQSCRAPIFGILPHFCVNRVAKGLVSSHILWLVTLLQRGTLRGFHPLPKCPHCAAWGELSTGWVMGLGAQVAGGLLQAV